MTNASLSSALISIAGRYAKALFQMAQDHHTSDNDLINGIANHLDAFTELLTSDEEIRYYFQSEALQKKERCLLVDKLAEQWNFPEMFGLFLKKLIENNRLKEIDQINLIYKRLLAAQEGRQRVEVSYVHPLTKKQSTALDHILQQYFQQKLNITYSLDSKLLAGIKIRFGSKIIDTSLLSKVENLLMILKGPY